MLTCQIVIHNDIKNINRLIDSLQPLDAELVVINDGGSDDDKEWLQQSGIKVFNVGAIKDYSKLRNMLIHEGRYDWQLIIHPWEILTETKELKKALQEPPKVYSLPIVKGDSLIYEERLWHRVLGVKFKNPIFERLDANGEPLQSMIFSDGDWLPSFDYIKTWKRLNPTLSEPMYYEAFYYLSKSDWDRFLSCSSRYLFSQQTATKPTMMMKYYTAVVLCHIKKDINSALKHTIECLALRPIIAEYWCLLGDIFYHLAGDLKKSQRFYRNAIVLGSQRDVHDMWPVELSKYHDYPTKMIESCKELERCKTIVKVPANNGRS